MQKGVQSLAYNEKAYKAAAAYKAKNIKRVPLDMQISEYEELKSVADAKGERVNQFIKTAIRQRMEAEANAKQTEAEPKQI